MHARTYIVIHYDLSRPKLFTLHLFSGRSSPNFPKIILERNVLSSTASLSHSYLSQFAVHIDFCSLREDIMKILHNLSRAGYSLRQPDQQHYFMYLSFTLCQQTTALLLPQKLMCSIVCKAVNHLMKLFSVTRSSISWLIRTNESVGVGGEKKSDVEGTLKNCTMYTSIWDTNLMLWYSPSLHEQSTALSLNWIVFVPFSGVDDEYSLETRA